MFSHCMGLACLESNIDSVYHTIFIVSQYTMYMFLSDINIKNVTTLLTNMNFSYACLCQLTISAIHFKNDSTMRIAVYVDCIKEIFMHA